MKLKKGHAPGHVREAFLDAAEAFEKWEPGTPEPTVDFESRPTPISALCRIVWNCTDIVPSIAFELAVRLRPSDRPPDIRGLRKSDAGADQSRGSVGNSPRRETGGVFRVPGRIVCCRTSSREQTEPPRWQYPGPRESIPFALSRNPAGAKLAMGIVIEPGRVSQVALRRGWPSLSSMTCSR